VADGQSGPYLHRICLSDMRQGGPERLMWLQQSMGFAHVKFLPSNPYTITGHVLGPSEAFRVRRKLPPEATRIIRDAGERDLATSESPPMAALKRLETPILHVKAAYKPANTTFPKTGDWISLSLPPPFPKRYSEKKNPKNTLKIFRTKLNIKLFQTYRGQRTPLLNIHVFWSKHAFAI
jgi:hypothetical protein